MSENESYILTQETLPAYLTTHAKDIGVFDASDELTAAAIVGGNVNYAFYVMNQEGKSVFVKQAPEFVAIFGPDGFPLTSERMQQELNVYKEWQTMLGDNGSKYLPKIHFFDRKCMVMVMEFFDGFELLDHVLVDASAGQVSQDVANGLGEFMGKTHAATHSSLVEKDRAASFTKDYENRAMRDVQLEFVFTKCYKEATDEQRAGLNVSEAFLKEVDTLKSQYDGGEADNLVLSHGDLHPGSVMIKDNQVKVIDPEFTVYGPPGLDVGSLLSGYVLAAVHQAYENRPEAVISICESAEIIWNSYKANMTAVSEETLRRIEVQTVGFAVAEVCRVALEFAGGRKWLQFEDAEKKNASRKAALGIVDHCMIRRHEEGMALLLSEMKQLARESDIAT